LKKAKNTTSDTLAVGASNSTNNRSTNGSSTGDLFVGAKTDVDIFKLNSD